MPPLAGISPVGGDDVWRVIEGPFQLPLNTAARYPVLSDGCRPLFKLVSVDSNAEETDQEPRKSQSSMCVHGHIMLSVFSGAAFYYALSND
jgi:hypothetical protein